MNLDSGNRQVLQQFSIAILVTGSNVHKQQLMCLSMETQWRTEKDGRRCSLLLTGKPFQFPHTKFFNHLLAQVHSPLPVLPIPQIPEIFGLLSGLDFAPCTQGSMDIRTSPTRLFYAEHMKKHLS